MICNDKPDSQQELRLREAADYLGIGQSIIDLLLLRISLGNEQAMAEVDVIVAQADAIRVLENPTHLLQTKEGDDHHER